MNNKIELKAEYRGRNSTIFSGRSEGKEAREKLKIDSCDDNLNQKYIIEIPDDTTSFNPSFFLGFFFPSIKKIGTMEAFHDKYSIPLSNFTDMEAKQSIEEDLKDCYRRAENELKSKTGLDL